MPAPRPGMRKRRWAPKSRRGCISCKQRRLRCDEEKPACQRCLKDGFDCDYNTLPPGKVTEPCCSPSTTPTTTKSTAIEVLPTYTSPAHPWSAPPDYMYLHFFLRYIAPLMSTTKQWRSMWQTTIPQCAWTSDAVRHSIIALAASWESFRSKSDRQSLVLKQTNLAIKAFRNETCDPDLALVICRMLASVAQGQQDWQAASTHLAWGARILRQQKRGKLSSIAKTLGPSYMAILNERFDDEVVGMKLTSDKHQIWSELLRFRLEYKRMYLKWLDRPWPDLHRNLKSDMLTAWPILNQAMSSALYPDLVFFTADDPVVPVLEVEMGLLETQQLLSLTQLSQASTALLKDIDEYLEEMPDSTGAHSSLKQRLRMIIENYVVQALRFEPQMSAGTFWSELPEPTCMVMLQLGHSHNDKVLSDVTDTSEDCSEIVDVERHNFYLEHVCPFRSGFMPLAGGQDLCSLTSHPLLTTA